jgi:hypothetical protein
LFLLDQIRCVVLGEPYLGEPVIQTPVLYLSERGERMLRPELDRCGMPSAGFMVVYETDVATLSWKDIVASVHRDCKDRGVKLVVIDTFSAFGRLKEEEENHAAVITPMIQMLRRLTEDGIAVVLVHHDKKAGAYGVTRARGSGAFTASSDNVLHLGRVEGDRRKVRRIECRGHFPEIPETSEINLTEACRYELWRSPIESATSVLRRQPSATVEDVAAASGVSIATAYRALKELRLTGVVSWRGEGTKADPHRYQLKSGKPSLQAASLPAKTCPNETAVRPRRVKQRGGERERGS